MILEIMPKLASFSSNYEKNFSKKFVNLKNAITFASALEKSGRKIGF